jgi:hypothetical protein
MTDYVLRAEPIMLNQKLQELQPPVPPGEAPAAPPPEQNQEQQ